MKFEEAYSSELNDYLTPYEARDLYFNEESDFHSEKLSFNCPSEKCRIPLTPVAIYRPDKTKTKIHFRTKVKEIHLSECEYYYDLTEYNEISEKNNKVLNQQKNTLLPTELQLEKPIRKKSEYIKAENSEKTFVEKKVNLNLINATNSRRKTNSKTPYLEHIIDCYEGFPEKELKNHSLTIGTKTKKFFYCFKKIEYFQDETGLIYWGEIKNLKKYGENYRIDFIKKAWVNKKPIAICIYIKSETINAYNKKEQFLSVLDYLTTFKDNIRCYFVASYPELKTIKRDNKAPFNTFDVKIENLEHLVFRFDKEIEE
ncbi:hypothetical protein ATE84_2339 [Aquimarina sp. MAR_2010_214]|uniref:hypothetical protein n=1 Tax=Aquimarina sp. MAR_2010_214 TaxID=1250026 RepID=UPI000C702FE7|nr:hypothetical protein [Aquimarina sp. MAR_2010_214]PKV50284.1 hypothetical protein ATE84_2339 [Aquimarina sp. MAR_2010_214]